eukprot:2532870-Alexandrium_andersonii.AAC.1
MSASLVGSEMCIRDRSAPRELRGAILRPCLGPAQFKLRTPQAVPHCPKSVSYTHLTLPTICSV